jgi:Sulfotransferase family
MKEFLKNFNSVGEFNYSVHISDEFRFVYFNNPKCACTTIKASLNLACAAALGRQLEYTNIGDIHDRSRNVLLTPAEIGYSRFVEILADASYFKFSFIREPIRRIISAFASKFSWKSESLVALNRRLGRADNLPVVLEEFIKVVSSDDNIRDMDEHWRLQRKQVCFDFVCFDKVGLFENLDSDLAEILCRLFGNEQQIFDVRRRFSGNVSNSNTLMQCLTEEIRSQIGRIYQPDVDMYAAKSNVSGTNLIINPSGPGLSADENT